LKFTGSCQRRPAVEVRTLRLVVLVDVGPRPFILAASVTVNHMTTWQANLGRLQQRSSTVESTDRHTDRHTNRHKTTSHQGWDQLHMNVINYNYMRFCQLQLQL